MRFERPRLGNSVCVLRRVLQYAQGADIDKPPDFVFQASINQVSSRSNRATLEISWTALHRCRDMEHNVCAGHQDVSIFRVTQISNDVVDVWNRMFGQATDRRAYSGAVLTEPVQQVSTEKSPCARDKKVRNCPSRQTCLSLRATLAVGFGAG
jgi:hypothetical protein